jgi:hypothetical protein
MELGGSLATFHKIAQQCDDDFFTIIGLHV